MRTTRNLVIFVLLIFTNTQSYSQPYTELSKYEQGQLHLIKGEFDLALDKWISLAKSGNKDAAKQIGDLYGYGLGVEYNHDEALKWYRRAIELGNNKAKNGIGLLYQKRNEINTALEWYNQAAKNSVLYSYHNIGNIYYDKKFGRQDYTKAAKWFKKAADLNLSISEYNLGLMYLKGRGVEQDAWKAYNYFKKASYKNVMLSQFNLAAMYTRIKKIKPKHLLEAYVWFSLASVNGLPQAEKGIEYVTNRFTGDMKKEADKLLAERSKIVLTNLKKKLVFEASVSNRVLEELDKGGFSSADTLYNYLKQLNYYKY